MSDFPEHRPKLIAFDCDWTVWRGDCDRDFIGPFHRDAEGFARDRFQQYSEAYYHVKIIIADLIDAGIPVAFVSRNPSYIWVKQLLQTIRVPSKTKADATLYDAMPDERYLLAFSTPVGYRAKDKHFADLHNISGVELTDMLFFDDAPDNINAAERQGITCVLAENREGVTVDAFYDGIKAWQKANPVRPEAKPMQPVQPVQPV
jgi:magnesium-dependent phosphatase-1